MMPSWFPTDVRLQAAVCAGLAAVTIMALRSSALRSGAVAVASFLARVSRTLASSVAWLFDKIMPVDDRNGSLPRLNFAVWVFLNLAVVACWIVASEMPTPAPFPEATAIAASAFAVLNLLLLGAAYWALRESVEVMNGEVPATARHFAETSTSRSAVLFAGTAGLLIAQIAVAVEWTQETQHVAFVSIDGAIAPRYFNFLVAMVDALPLASTYVVALSEHASFAPGLWGLSLHRGLNGLGSILIVSTAIGFIQQRVAFHRMVDSLVNVSEADFPPALRERFKNAPSAIKSYVLARFRTETDDRKRLRLAQLAVDRRSYSFPKVFAASYGGLSDAVREQGSLLVAAFLDDKQCTFYPATLHAILDACERGQRSGGFRVVERRRIARFLVPCLEQLAAHDADAAAARIQTVMVQKVLCSALNARIAPALRERAARLLARVSSYYAIAPLVRAVPILDESVALTVLAAAARTLGNRGISFPPAKNLWLLGRMAAAARETRRRPGLSPAVAASLVKVRDKIEARLQAATAAIDRQKNAGSSRRRRPRRSASRALPKPPHAIGGTVVAVAAAEQAAGQ